MNQSEKGFIRFLERAKEKHGDKFDYSKAEYVNYGTPITIICPEHGEFTMRPDCHLNSPTGCRECSPGYNAPLNTDLYIQRAVAKHGDTFDYSKTVYTGDKNDVIITCRKHGDFKQNPRVHLLGSVCCPKCHQELLSDKFTLGKDEFIRRSREIHGDKFDYSLVEYTNQYNKVKIICSVHGVFEQAPTAHMAGSGCFKCGHEVTADKRRIPKDEFVRRSRLVHGDLYNYDKSDYKGNDVPVTITCPVHGDFQKRPTEHWAGSGCNICAGIVPVTNEEYIRRVEDFHGPKYDHSITQYRGMGFQIQYKCDKHGVISQLAYDHLKSGCKYCANNVAWDSEKAITSLRSKFGDKYQFELVDDVKNKMSKIKVTCEKHGVSYRTLAYAMRDKATYACVKCARYAVRNDIRKHYEEIIPMFRKRHGNKYDYSLVPKDVVLKDDIQIICPEHGVFVVNADLHFNGKGICPKCDGRDRSTEDWVEMFREVHGNKFIYPPEIKYNTINDKIEIICPKHGPFMQELNAHRCGQGCPSCRESHMEKKVAASLRLRGINYERQKRFDWLRFVGPQSLDFYIPELNVAIECQGIQHFTVKNEYYKMSAKNLKDIQIRDKNKFELCRQHGIRVLYFCTDADWIPDEYYDTIYRTQGALMDEILRIKSEREAI